MSLHQHQFIASISTHDVEQLLTRQYADVSEKANELHLQLSRFISNKVGPRPSQSVSKKKATDIDAGEIIRAYGLIDDIRIYDRALSTEEIEEIFSGSGADLTGDGDVDVEDFAIVAYNWLDSAW